MSSEHVRIDEIRDYINKSFAGDSGVILTDDDDLLEVLDSLQVMRLVVDFESMYAIKFHNSDMTPENLGSMAKLAAFVNSKR
jgi:acyl carrier protein